MSDLFIKASREKFRFPSNRGELTVEQLWDLPLQSKSGFDLDTTAKAINRDLKAAVEESFVARANPASTLLEAKLEVVKYVIAAKHADNAAALAEAGKAQQKAKLIAILANKQDAALENLTEAEIKARLDALA